MTIEKEDTSDPLTLSLMRIPSHTRGLAAGVSLLILLCVVSVLCRCAFLFMIYDSSVVVAIWLARH